MLSLYLTEHIITILNLNIIWIISLLLDHLEFSKALRSLASDSPALLGGSASGPVGPSLCGGPVR